MQMRPHQILAAAALALLALSGALPVRAQGILFPEHRPILPPRPIPQPVQPFYVKNLRVNTVINDAVAETTVEQTFVNSASIQQEGTYLYPLPEGATPSSFTMTVGDKTMEPRILTHDEARTIYEGYVRRYKDPALLEYVGRNLVKISVFPIPPQGERVIRMRYTEVLKPQGEVRKYVYPLSTSRFGARPVGTTTVSIKLMTTSAIKNVYSPTHDLSVRKTDDKTATASWEGVNDTSDRDLTLFYSTSNDDVGLSLLNYKSGDRDGYFMLLASPRVSIPKDRILPKHVVFVLDRTGSMQGKKIEQARKSLLFCLSHLHPQDRFDVITFNESPDVLMRTLVPANEENLAKARRFVENIEASGGTNIDDALKAALALFKEEEGKENMIVFLTDGLPTIGETNINTILQHFKDANIGKPTSEATPKNGPRPAGFAGKKETGKQVRLFSFGLGYDVNVPFLDRLADLGRGESDYVKPEEDVEAKVSSFYAKVTSPILSDVKVAFDGADVYDVYPKVIPDLFKGSQLVISGRFRGEGKGTVRLTGQANGTDETFRLNTAFNASDGSNTFLPRIWAARKLGYLIDQVRLSENPEGKKEVIDEIVRLSRDYGIITEYTSFLVDEREQMALGLRDRNGQLPPGSPPGDILALTPDNAVRLRQEVARRAVQNGINGEKVTDQSGRAKDLKSTGQAYSRYQSANGSVHSYAELGTLGEKGDKGAGGPGTLAGRGNFGGQGGFGFGGGAGGYAGGGRPSAQKRTSGSSSGPAGAADDAERNAINLQAVGDRTFYRQSNNVWQDQSYDPKKQKNLVKIQAFSDAHFALLKAVPSLAAYSSVGEELIVRLNNNAIQIGRDGKERLSAAELKDLTGK
jgi:Ca-activated chloride channel family protein